MVSLSDEARLKYILMTIVVVGETFIFQIIDVFDNPLKCVYASEQLILDIGSPQVNFQTVCVPTNLE